MTGRREVVSFVRRSTRMNPSQQKAWNRLHDRYVIEPAPGEKSTSIADDAQLDTAIEFARPGPLIVEIGSGAGEALATMAANRPRANVLAFEVFLPAVASTLSRLARADIDNVRLITRDGAAGLTQLVASAGLEELWTFFPDPWHKGRHHKRRLVSAAFADLVADRLAPGGRWRLATDWAEYADHVHAVLDPHPRFVLESTDRADRPVTKYEQRGLAAGRTIVDLCYRRLP